MLLLCTLLFFSLADAQMADEFLAEANATLTVLGHDSAIAEWNYETDLTDANEAAATEAALAYDEAVLELVERAHEFDDNYDDMTEDEIRQIEILELYASVPSDEQLQEELENTINEMSRIYSTAEYNGMPLTPDLEEIMATSRDYNELMDAWKGWRDVTGPEIRPLYPTYVNLSNIGATDNGFDDAGVLWRSGYDMSTSEFEQLAESLWQDILPLYEDLHCYVRGRLTQVYGADKFSSDGMIPAHLLGNMWAQSWGNIYDLVVPYPEVDSVDLTQALVDAGYDAVQIHEAAEDFYVSLGFDSLPDSFWELSELVKPTDGREMVCHASAWDFNNDDIRIKMCTEVNSDDFMTAHHEQGHLYYYHYYKDLTYVYRDGANDGFHEAIGDTVQLSTLPPHHLADVGLIDSYESSYEADINFLMSVALDKIAFLPFGYLIDQWRWRVFDESTTEGDYNAKWWDARHSYQGVKSPQEVVRSENDFDPAAKYHIDADVPYIRYFLAHIYQFEFHQALCDQAGYVGDLYNCSVYGSTAAGDQFKALLGAGRSVPWQDTHESMTGSATMSADAILSYFAPLQDWLQSENARNGWEKGWVTTPVTNPDAEASSSSGSSSGMPDGMIVAVTFLTVVGVSALVASMYLWHRRRVYFERVPEEL